jgi:tetratricopeptide (TPR) repeat protein
MWRNGDLRGGADRLAQALDVLADDEPDAEIAELVEMLARLTYFLGEHELAWDRVERALEIAESLPAPTVLVDGLNTKSLLLFANARYEEASALLQHAIALGREHDLGAALVRAINNQCVDFATRARYPDMEAAAREGTELAGRFGLREQEQQFLGFAAVSAWLLGEWAECDALVERFTAVGNYPALFRANAIVFPGTFRGPSEELRRTLGEVEALRDSDDAQIAAGILRLDGLVLYAEGRFAESAVAQRKSQAVLSTVHPRLDSYGWSFELHALADGADAAGLEDRLAARDALSAVERTPFVEAQYSRFRGRLLGLRGETADAREALESAARQFAALGTRFFEAATLDELAEAGGPPVPTATRALLERIDAKPLLERIDALERSVTV